MCGACAPQVSKLEWAQGASTVEKAPAVVAALLQVFYVCLNRVHCSFSLQKLTDMHQHPEELTSGLVVLMRTD